VRFITLYPKPGAAPGAAPSMTVSALSRDTYSARTARGSFWCFF
jgi:hypothetical protein